MNHNVKLASEFIQDKIDSIELQDPHKTDNYYQGRRDAFIEAKKIILRECANVR